MYLYIFGLGKCFSKMQRILHLKGNETDKLDFIKIKSISSSKETIRELNKQIRLGKIPTQFIYLTKNLQNIKRTCVTQ